MENYYLGNGKRWLFSEAPSENQSPWGEEIPGLIGKLLYQRNIKNKDEMDLFFHPTLEALYDPFLLEGMDAAADRIADAIRNKEKILVYGDYDADGVSATAILVRFFRSRKVETEYYIPDRIEEGYGISDIAAEYISDNGYDLVITVDCGITARFQVENIYERASEKGKPPDIIITDHHHWNGKLMPEAVAVIDPMIPGSKYPSKNLCGAGLALKLVQGVSMKLGIPHSYEDYLDLAALATVADIVDLNGENRIITKYGIEKIMKHPCVGIQALLKASSSRRNKMDSYGLSFLLAPRINAAGRMGDAKCAVRLFTTDDAIEAEKIALLLNESNTKRKEIQEEIFQSAVKIIESDAGYKNDMVTVVWGHGWHHGVIGIVASKLVELYHKPAFVFSADDDKAVGSGRSIDGFNLFDAMESQSDLLIKFGGHEQAGGLTLMAQDLELFRERINEYARGLINKEMLVPALAVNFEVTPEDICLKNAKMISLLEPFGCGNPNPIFCFRGAVILNKKPVGNGKHLKLTLGIGDKTVDAVYFGKGTLDSGIVAGDRVDIVFTLEVNCWNNTEYLQLRICDMRLDRAALERNRFLLDAARRVECLDYDENWLYNGIIDKKINIDDIIVNRNTLGIIYKYIVHRKLKALSVADLFIHAGIMESITKKKINYFQFFVALLVFDELGLLGFNLEKDGTYSIALYDDGSKVDLGDSEILAFVDQAVQDLKNMADQSAV